MSGPGSNSSFEVVASTRRRWSPQERQAILSEAGGGVSVSEVARRHGLSRELLFRWRRELRQKAGSTTESAGFIPLSLPAPRSGTRVGIEVLLASGARLMVSEQTDLAFLKRVMAALS